MPPLTTLNLRIRLVAIAILLAAGLGIGLGLSLTSAKSDSESVFETCMGEEGRPTGAKLVEEESLCRQRAGIAAQYTPAEVAALKEKALEKPAATAPPPGPRAHGIIQDPEPPAGAGHTFVSTGRWAGEVDGVWYAVFAGASVDPATGKDVRSEVRVYKEKAQQGGDEMLPLVGVYEAPGEDTEPLELTAENGNVLSLKTEDGQTFSFDVAAKSFG